MKRSQLDFSNTLYKPQKLLNHESNSFQLTKYRQFTFLFYDTSWFEEEKTFIRENHEPLAVCGQQHQYQKSQQIKIQFYTTNCFDLLIIFLLLLSLLSLLLQSSLSFSSLLSSSSQYLLGYYISVPAQHRMPQLAFQPCACKKRIAYNPSLHRGQVYRDSASSPVIADKQGQLIRSKAIAHFSNVNI